jgi:hydroxypyruvate isomerase
VLELSACIEWLFWEEEAFADRIFAAVAADIRNVEFWTWRDKDIGAIGSALVETGARVEAFVSEPTGHLVNRETHDAFIVGVAESARIAGSIGCHKLVVLAGDTIEDLTAQEQHNALTRALERAAPTAAEQNVTLLLEPLNSRVDHCGHFLDSTERALTIVEEVDSPNVRLLLDLYHATVMEEALQESICERTHLIGHIHLADAPGRHEPGTGKVNWEQTIGWLKAAGYSGRLGLEYQPVGDTLSSLTVISRVLQLATEDDPNE